MSPSTKRRQILAIVATDSTFALAEQRGSQVWAGRCIHCNRVLAVALDGTPLGPVTIEHIVPRNHGGTDDVANLALACAGCNSEKGRRHDNQRKDDPRRLELLERLQEKRRARWREPRPS